MLASKIKNANFQHRNVYATLADFGRMSLFQEILGTIGSTFFDIRCMFLPVNMLKMLTTASTEITSL